VAKDYGMTTTVVEAVEARRELITAGRALRADYGIAAAQQVRFIIHVNEVANAARLEAARDVLATLLRAEAVEIKVSAEALPIPGTLVKIGTIYLPLEGLIDIPAEIKRLNGELDKARGFLKGVEAKLSNESFVSKAPAAIIEQQRLRKDELGETIERLERLINTLAQ